MKFVRRFDWSLGAWVETDYMRPSRLPPWPRGSWPGGIVWVGGKGGRE